MNVVAFGQPVTMTVGGFCERCDVMGSALSHKTFTAKQGEAEAMAYLLERGQIIRRSGCPKCGGVVLVHVQIVVDGAPTFWEVYDWDKAYASIRAVA